jgi:hypothetical protein
MLYVFFNVSTKLFCTNTINICFILFTIYIVIPVSGSVGRGPSALICPGSIMLLRRPWILVMVPTELLSASPSGGLWSLLSLG